MIPWILGYDGTLYLKLSEEETDQFAASAFYKLSLRRYCKTIQDGLLRFKPELTYLDFQKIIQLVQKETEKRGQPFVIAEELEQYISDKELYIEKRYRLGMEIKDRDDKLIPFFEEYRDIVNHAMDRKLREQQMWDSFFMFSMKKCSNFSVPGSGKTASALGVYACLRSRKQVSRVLVVCPKNAFGSWIDEFSACFGNKEPLKVFNYHDKKYNTRKKKIHALQFDTGGCNLILINYEAVGGVLKVLQSIVGQKTLLVFDEVHKVKRVGGEYASQALELAKHAVFTIAMTGTPIPNQYLDIYNMLHILYPDEYDVFFGFSPRDLTKPDEQQTKRINDKLQPFFCRTTKEQLDVPAVNADRIMEVEATRTENQILHILRVRYRKNKLALLVRILQLECNPHKLLDTLDLSEFSYLVDDTKEIEEIDVADYGDEIQDLIENCGVPEKFSACISLTEELVGQGKTVIIWCIFIDSINRLKVALNSRGISTKCIFGEIPVDERKEILEDFKKREFQVLITNPHTLAESVSLHSVCHDAIYFEYSYNLVHLLQSKDRIHRLGLSKEQYTQYYYMQTSYRKDDGEEWSMDRMVYERLCEKEQIMLQAIDRHELESMPTTEEDLEKIFEGLY